MVPIVTGLALQAARSSWRIKKHHVLVARGGLLARPERGGRTAALGSQLRRRCALLHVLSGAQPTEAQTGEVPRISGEKTRPQS